MDELLQAIEALNAGDKPKARQMLTVILKKHPTNESAWQWMSQAVDDPDKRRMCLEQVMLINPTNSVAKRALAELVHPSPEEPARTVQARYCSNCGAQVVGNFCANCGQPAHQTQQAIRSEGGTQSPKPVVVHLPATPTSRFSAKRTIAAVGLGLIVMAGLLAWENTSQWYGILLGGYKNSSVMGLTTLHGILSTISAVFGLVILFAVKEETTAHLLGALMAILSAVLATVFMAGTGRIDRMIYDLVEYSSSAGVGVYMVFTGAAITLGCFLIPTRHSCLD